MFASSSTRNLLFGLALTLSLSLQSSNASALPTFQLKGSWKMIKQKKGVKVYQMRIPGSRLIAIRGDIVLHAPIAKVVALLNNVSTKRQWIDRLAEIKLLARYSPLHFVEYTRFNMPWPVAAREVVSATQTFVYPAQQRVVRYQWSVEHPNAPKKAGIVRAQVHYIRYTLESRTQGAHTFMKIEGYGNPKGSLPAFLVNMIQRQWPLRTLLGIQKLIHHPSIKSCPIITKALQRHPRPHLVAFQK